MPENEVRELETENNFWNGRKKEMIKIVVKEKRFSYRSCDKILMRLEPEYAGLEIKVSQAIGEWCCKKLEIRN